MKLSMKLTLSMSLLTLLIVLVGFFSLGRLEALNTSTNELALEWLPKTRWYGRLNTLTSDYRVQEMMHVLADNQTDMAKYDEIMKKLLDEISATEKILTPLIVLPEAKKILLETKAAWAEYLKEHEQIRKLSLEVRNAEAIVLLAGKSNDYYTAVGASLQKLNNMNTEASNKIAVDTDVLFLNSVYLILIAIFGAVVSATLLVVFIVRNVKKLLGKDPTDLGKIAERVVDGDYDIDDNSPKIGVYGKIVMMVQALKENIENAQKESLRAQQESVKAQEAMKVAEIATIKAESAKREGMLAAATQLEDVVGILASASEELSVQIEHSEHGANESSARMAETATAMEEMNSTVTEVAKNAAEAFNLSKLTREKAINGAHLVEQAVQSVQKVQTDSMSLKDDMVKLSENAQAINQIMGVISDIADQTNLLALNAAIEAARAGEAGRGFAVVADEVRKLAEKTMISTSDVGNAIRAIQDSAAKSMNQVDITVKNVEVTTLQSIKSGEALKEIVEMVDRSSDQVNAIATASEEQSATSEEINRSVAHVNSITAETSNAMQEATRAVAELARQAQVLDGLIDNMKKQS